MQLDEIAAPLLLAWRLHQQKVSLHLFNPRVMMVRAAAYLILHGPVTCQERWEENAGYSPSTLATVIAALVCAAELAREHHHPRTADFILDLRRLVGRRTSRNGRSQPKANWWKVFPAITSESIRPMLTTPDPHADPNTTMIQIANGGGLHPARNVVGGDFLHLVRFGIRSADDPIVLRLDRGD